MPGGSITPDLPIWTYDADEDGALAVGTLFSPWFSGQGISEIYVIWGATTPANTTITVEQSMGKASDEADVESSSLAASSTAGQVVRIIGRAFRVKVVQATAPGAGLAIAVKGAD